MINKTLKNLMKSFKKGEITTPNIQVIDKIFSDEIINLPVLLDETFGWASFRKSRLTKIKFCNGSFESSFFEDCFLENCVFSNIYFEKMESLECIFKDCLFMGCSITDTDISETIFESCTFSKGSLCGSVFESCHFINTVFRDVVIGSAVLIDSKFSNSKKSIEFEGKVYFSLF